MDEVEKDLLDGTKLPLNLGNVQSAAFVHSLNRVPEDEVVLRVQKFERSCLCPTRYLNIVISGVLNCF